MTLGHPPSLCNGWFDKATRSLCLLYKQVFLVLQSKVPKIVQSKYKSVVFPVGLSHFKGVRLFHFGTKDGIILTQMVEICHNHNRLSARIQTSNTILSDYFPTQHLLNLYNNPVRMHRYGQDYLYKGYNGVK